MLMGMRTPQKKDDEDKSSPKPRISPPSVRRSVGEWEAAKNTGTNPTPPLTTKTMQAGPAKAAQKPTESQEAKTLQMRAKPSVVHTPPKLQYADRSQEARACLNKAKLHLSSSRNLKTEIKNGIVEALDRLFQLVKEAEKEATTKKSGGVKETTVPETAAADVTFSVNAEQNFLATQLEEHSKLLQESNKRMDELRTAMERGMASTYASVAATHSGKPFPARSTLHSIVVTSKDDTETGDEVLDKIRKAVDAKEGWVKVERVRKAKDKKIIMGFQTREERSKMKTKLEGERRDLNVEEMKNRDPLLVLRSVLSGNSDEDVLRAMRNQNRDVFHGLDKEENRAEVKYRRRTRNPHTCHVVVSVSPTIWRRTTEIGSLHIDLQRVRVEDQTPLVQCTRCLGYGHGRRFCKEPADLCSHCGGPHLRSECADWLAGVPPKCHNCTGAKLDDADHNAFSLGCPTRRKWDEIARSTVAYC